MLKALQILKEMLEQNQDSNCINELKEAIEELEALNNRSCSNCKYQNMVGNSEFKFTCCKIPNIYSKPTYLYDDDYYRFSCNKWEPK